MKPNSQMACQEAIKSLMDYNERINAEYDKKKKTRSADYSKCLETTHIEVGAEKTTFPSDVCDERSKRSEKEDAKWYESQMQLMDQLRQTMSNSCG